MVPTGQRATSEIFLVDGATSRKSQRDDLSVETTNTPSSVPLGTRPHTLAFRAPNVPNDADLRVRYQHPMKTTNGKTYKEKLADIDTFIFDVDGVFTDDRVFMMPDMEPVRVMYTRDAYAVQLAVREDLRLIIMSGGSSKGVADSFGRLGIKEVHMSVSHKMDKLQELISEGLDLKHSAYMGNDIPDIQVMEQVAFAACPKDAAEEVKAISHYISRYPGGGGCVRDLLEQVMKVQGKWMQDGAYTW